MRTSAYTEAGERLAKKRRKSVNVILTAEEYGRFQKFCARRGHKKSTLVARLIRDYLDGQKFMMQSELPLNRLEPRT